MEERRQKWTPRRTCPDPLYFYMSSGQICLQERRLRRLLRRRIPESQFKGVRKGFLRRLFTDLTHLSSFMDLCGLWDLRLRTAGKDLLTGSAKVAKRRLPHQSGNLIRYPTLAVSIARAYLSGRNVQSVARIDEFASNLTTFKLLFDVLWHFLQLCAAGIHSYRRSGTILAAGSQELATFLIVASLSGLEAFGQVLQEWYARAMETSRTEIIIKLLINYALGALITGPGTSHPLARPPHHSRGKPQGGRLEAAGIITVSTYLTPEAPIYIAQSMARRVLTRLSRVMTSRVMTNRVMARRVESSETSQVMTNRE